MSQQRNQLKDALRASIDTEDAAIARRSPGLAGKRKQAVKAGVKAHRRELGAGAPAVPAKPTEVILSTDEAAALKALRERLKADGIKADKSTLIRLAVGLLDECDPGEIARRITRVAPLVGSSKGK